MPDSHQRRNCFLTMKLDRWHDLIVVCNSNRRKIRPRIDDVGKRCTNTRGGKIIVRGNRTGFAKRPRNTTVATRLKSAVSLRPLRSVGTVQPGNSCSPSVPEPENLRVDPGLYGSYGALSASSFSRCSPLVPREILRRKTGVLAGGHWGNRAPLLVEAIYRREQSTAE